MSVASGTTVWAGRDDTLWAAPETSPLAPPRPRAARAALAMQPAAASHGIALTSVTTIALAAGGTLSAATVNGAAGGPMTFVPGGAAASLLATGNVGLFGSCTLSGALGVGMSAQVAGVLLIGAGATVTAATVNVPSGALRLASQSAVAVSGAASLGEADTIGAAGSVTVGPGATLAVTGSLSAPAGTLIDDGGTVSIGGGAALGFSGTVQSSGRLAVTSGGTVSVAGPVAASRGMLVADGAGAALRLAGTLTTGAGGTWITTPADVAGALLAVNGGTVQVGGLILASLSAVPLADTAVTVDAASVIEVGSAGGAASGALTIDPGRVLVAEATALIDAALVDDGTLIAAAGTLTQRGAVSGSGTIVIGSGATWMAESAVGAADTIVFSGSNAALSIGAGVGVAATLAGFQSGGTILVAGSVTAASISAGTLTLSGGNGVAETLRLAASVANESVALRATAGGTAVQLAPSAGGPASTNADVFAWTASGVGDWGSSGNWQDLTAGLPVPLTVPGSLTPVLIAGGQAGVSIGGGGTAASLALTGAVSLGGGYVIAGSLDVGTVCAVPSQGLAGGMLTLAQAATMAAGALAVDGGGVTVDAGATLAVAGTAAIGFAGGYQVAAGAAFANAGAGPGVADVAAGGTLTAGTLWVQDGTLADAGQVAAGTLTIGSAGGILSTAPVHTIGKAPGTVVVASAGTLAVAGGIAAQAGMLVADGGRVTAGGTLLAGAGGRYTYDDALGLAQLFGGAAIAINGGSVDVGGLVLGGGALLVDAASAIEVGSAADASAGALTIDAGRTVTVRCSTETEANLVDNGLVCVTGGTLTQSGAVSGSGTIALARDAALLLDGAIGPGATIGFLDTGAMLVIGGAFSVTASDYVTAACDLNAVVTRFCPGDAIAVLEPADAIGFNAGTLTLSEAGAPVEVVTLAGSFGGETFVASHDAAGDAVISLMAAEAGSAPSSNADTFAWTGGSVGAWGAASDWRDTAANAPALAAPGLLTPVTLAGTAEIAGGGVAGSVMDTGSFALTGVYAISNALTVAGALEETSGGVLTASAIVLAAGTLALDAAATMAAAGAMAVGTAGSASLSGGVLHVASPGSAGTLTLGMAATLTAASLALASGVLDDADGTVSIRGAATLGSTGLLSAAGVAAVTDGGRLTVSGGLRENLGIIVADGVGSLVQVGGTLQASGGAVYGAASLPGGNVAASVAAVNGGTVVLGDVVLASRATGLWVDGESAIEVGAAGDAAMGAITVDGGATIASSATATLNGRLVNDGVVLVSGGTLTQAGGVSGSGTVLIGAGAMWVNRGSVASGQTIVFQGSGGALFDAGGPMGGTIDGFGAGDSLIVAAPVTAAAFTAGTLVLGDLGTTVASFLLAGAYTGQSFVATPGYGGSVITLAQAGGTPAFTSAEGGRLSQAGTIWTLNLGAVAQGGPAPGDTIGIVNTGSGTLSGLFTASGASAFTNTPPAAGIAVLGPGGIEPAQTITLSTASAGIFTEAVVMTPAGGATILPAQTLIVTGTVLAAGSVVSIGTIPVTLTAGSGNDVFNATVLASGDRLDGGGGTNFLTLIGSGPFNLAEPAVLSDIQVVTASEASGPTILTRPGTSQTITLSPAPSGGSATIVGGADSDVFNLGSGTDTVILGSAAETVRAGSGTALIDATAGETGAAVIGAIGACTTLAVTSGGSATLAAADCDLTVRLGAATHLALGSARFVSAIGSGGSDTIIAGAANQTLTGGGGRDLLVGWAGFGDSFADTAAGFSGDVISGFGGNDAIDVTDLSFGNLRAPSVLAAGTESVLRLTDGVRSTAITLLGRFTSGEFSFAADNGGGVLIRL